LLKTMAMHHPGRNISFTLFIVCGFTIHWHHLQPNQCQQKQ
jgi:hypothetical protein